MNSQTGDRGDTADKAKNATRWCTRQMEISRIWRAFTLAPHRSQTFKLSTDPFFVDQVRDFVGLYVNSPEGALVPCMDGEALDTG
jgi:hypothetical protein